MSDLLDLIDPDLSPDPIDLIDVDLFIQPIPTC